MARFCDLRPATPLPAILTLGLVACSVKPADTTLVASGTIEATEVRIATKVGGRLVYFPLDRGAVVSAGQEVARIDTVDLELELEAARAERAAAGAELDLRLAGARREDIAEAEAVVARAEAERTAAERDRDRFRRLLASGSGTEKLADDAETRLEVAARSLEAARQRLARLRAGSRREEIAAARAHVEAVEARIAQIEQRIADARVESPAAGIVDQKLAEPGELVPAGSVLLVVNVLTDTWLTAWVGEPDLGRVRIGQEAEVVTDGGERRTGRVSFIASEAEFTPKNVQTRDERVKLVYELRVAVDNADGLFKPGMPAEARLQPVASRGGR